MRYDLLVIGAGSGGVRAARLAAGHGMRVLVAESGLLGGTCVNLGCIPKKLLHYAAEFTEDFERAAAFGWQLPTGGRLDWATLRANKDKELDRLRGVYRRVLIDAGVQLIEGRARVIGPHEVAVGKSRHTAERILVATGSRPWVPDVPGREHVVVSDDIFSLATLPRRVVVVGGGYIAVEFACILNGFGAHTNLVYRGALPLRGFDRELREFLLEQMRTHGVGLYLNAQVAAIERVDDGQLAVQLQDGGEPLAADLVLYATGRVPNTHDLGLEEIGVRMDNNGRILIDAGFRSSVNSIYALGDAVGRAPLTPVALAEAGLLVRILAGETNPGKLDYESIPTAVFSHPPLAVAGLLNEDKARQIHGEVAVRRSLFTPLQYTLGGPPGRALLKVLAATGSGRLIGAGMVGPDAGELIQGLAVAISAGATLNDLGRTLGIHPTLAEEFVALGNSPYKPAVTGRA